MQVFMISRSARTSVAAALLIAATAAQAVTTVFADSFDDGNVADWSTSSSANITAPVVTLRNDDFVSGPGALYAYFDAPGGGTGAGFVRASHSFTAPVTGTYLLDLWARSSPCQGCTMSFDVIVDGALLQRDGTAPLAFVHRSYNLPALAAGPHTLTLGMFTDGASSGRFNASFDDVTLTTEVAVVPEPGAASLLLAGLLAGALVRRR